MVNDTKYKVLAQGTIALTDVVVKSNFRQVVHSEKLKELAADIKTHGVMTSIILRPGGDKATDKMILVDGARRLEASKIAGLKEIRYTLMELTEETAAEAQVVANLHREDLNPIDEAKAFQSLIEGGSYSKEDLAARVNKDISYVTRAVRLLELPERAQESIMGGFMTASHGHRLLALPPEQREKALQFLDDREYKVTVSDLENHISATFGRSLDHVPFPVESDYGGRPACMACDCNEANQAMLFGVAKDSRCLDAACFAAKMEAFHQFLADQAAGKFKGLKYIGAGTFKLQEWRNFGSGSKRILRFKKAYAMDDMEKTPVFKAALKKTPERLCYGVDTEERKAVMLILDPDLLNEICPKKVEPVETAEQKALREKKEMESAKKAFIESKGNGHIVREFLLGKKPLPDEMIKAICPYTFNNDSLSELIMKFLGLNHLTTKTIKKLDKNTCLKLALLNAISDMSGIQIEELKAYGLDFKKIRAAAVPEAEAEWEKKHIKKGSAMDKAAAAGQDNNTESDEGNEG